MKPVLIRNAMVMTVDPAMTLHERGHVLVEDGAIAAIGPGDGPARPDAEIVDAGGDLVMPGMVNTHCHMPMTLFRGLGEDVDDRLFRYVLPLERKFVTPEMVRVGSRLAALEMIEGGVTTVADMYYYETEIGRVLDESGMRGLAGQTLADFDPPDHKTMDEGFALFDQLAEEFAGHPRVTASLAPHAPYSTGPEVLKRVAKVWEKTGLPVQLHLAEMDSEMKWTAKHHGKRPVGFVADCGLLREGLICAHCLHCNPAEIELMAKAGARVAHNARSNSKAGRGIAPVASMRSAGVKVGIGTDGPMSGNTLDLFSQFAPVSMLQKLLAHSRKPMAATEVIQMATIGGAEVLGLAGKIGSLEVGKRADLVRIDLSASRMAPLYDIYAQLVFAALPTDVRDVMVEGSWLLRDRAIRTLDRAQVIADANAIARQFKAEMARIDG